MGAWGYEPWQNDTAADWFHAVLGKIDLDAEVSAALNGDDESEIRAACYLLATLGRVYVWPGDLDVLASLLEQGIAHLSAMIDPDSDMYYLDEWRDPEAALEAIQGQLNELQARRARIRPSAQ